MSGMADKQAPQVQPAPGLEGIARTLREMKFRKKLLGGVDEADVWKKLEKLQQEYEIAYHQQAAYYQALLDDRERALHRLMEEKGGVACG